MMKKQQQLILLILFVYSIRIHCIIVVYLNENQLSNSSSNCFRVENDEGVVTSNEFNIPRNPNNSNSKSYASIDNKRRILHLKIVDQALIPSMIFGLTYLKRLEVRNTCFSPCNRQTVPSDIECLASSLIELSISHTKITHLPNEIGKLKGLRTLKLSNTGLTSLPDSIGDLSSLAILYLPNNNLKSLPVTMKNLRSLQQITLSNNPSLRSIQPLNGLPTLKILNTRHCPIAVLPQNLPQLTDLYMTNNILTNLTGIETLGSGTSNKKFFDFDRNRISTIPSQIQQVKNLSRLNLDHNQLNNLTKTIFNITTLSYLNLDHNKFHPRDLKTIIFKFRNTNPNLTIVPN